MGNQLFKLKVYFNFFFQANLLGSGAGKNGKRFKHSVRFPFVPPGGLANAAVSHRGSLVEVRMGVQGLRFSPVAFFG